MEAARDRAEARYGNPRLDRWLVQDLNVDPVLPLDDGAFEAALCCVGVQYLQALAIARACGHCLRMSVLLSRRELDARRFPRAQLDTLFDLVQIDSAAALPDRILLDHDPAMLADAFRICRQLWIEGVNPAELATLVVQVGREGDLSPADRTRFKHMRAKLKLFRFAFALFGRSHTYPTLTDHLTTALGHLQDGFRNGQRRRVTQKAWHVAFYTAAHTLQPCKQFASMFFSLAATDGLMGDMHDSLVERRVAGLQDYHNESFQLPGDIVQRIAALVERYRASET